MSCLTIVYREKVKKKKKKRRKDKEKKTRKKSVNKRIKNYHSFEIFAFSCLLIETTIKKG